MEEFGDEELKNGGAENEELAGIDFSQVPLSQMEGDKGTSRTLIEDENFEFQVTNP